MTLDPSGATNPNFLFSKTSQVSPMRKHEVDAYLKQNHSYVHSPKVTKGLYNTNFMFKSN